MDESDGVPLLNPGSEVTKEERKETLSSRLGSRIKSVMSSLWERKYLLLVLIAAFFNALQGLLFKTVLFSLDPILVGVVGLMTITLCCIPAIVYRRPKLTASPEIIGVLLLTGSLRGVMTILSMVAFKNINVGDAEAIISSRPVIVGLLAWVILSEQLTILDGIASICAFLGVLLLARPTIIFDTSPATDYDQKTLIGSLSAIGVAFMIATTGVLRRVLSQTEIDKNVSLFYIYLVAAVVCAAACTALGEWELPEKVENQIFVVSSGVLGYSHGLLTIIALGKEKTYHVFLVKSSTFVMLYVLQYIFLGVSPDISSVIGSMGIILAIVLVTKSKSDSDDSDE